MSAFYNSLDFTLLLEVLKGKLLSENPNTLRKDLAQGLVVMASLNVKTKALK